MNRYPVKPLARDVKILAVSHGHEENEHGRILLRRGDPVEVVGPSQVPGWLVIRWGVMVFSYARVKPDAV